MVGLGGCCGAASPSGEQEGDREREEAPSGALLRFWGAEMRMMVAWSASETENQILYQKRCERGIACNFGRRAPCTSVSPDAHLDRPTEGHTPAQGNASVSACTYSPTPQQASNKLFVPAEG